MHDAGTSSLYERWIRGLPLRSRIAIRLAIVHAEQGSALQSSASSSEPSYNKPLEMAKSQTDRERLPPGMDEGADAER